MRSLIPVALLLAACAGPTIPDLAVSGGGGSAGRGADGGSSGASGVSGNGAVSGASGVAGTSGASGAAGTSGASGVAGAGGGGAGASPGGAAGVSGGGNAGAAGQGPLVEQACDFSGAGTDCVRCGGSSCIDTHSDPAHCGACGHACDVGVACRNAVCGGQTIVTAPASYTSGVLFEGRLFAWGANGGFQTGGGAGGPFWIYTPEEAKAFGSDIAMAQVAGSTLVVDAQGNVRGTGWNGQGQLGVGTTGGPDACADQASSCYATPAKAAKVSGVAELRFGDHWCGGSHACARHADRSVSCWGDLGGACGTKNVVVIPQKVALPASAGLAVTYAARCARACDGSVWCWGRNNRKQLGIESPDEAKVPVQIPGLRLTQIAAGFEHFCGIDEGGDVICWGASAAGQSGALADTLPNKVAGVGHAVQLAMGHAISCALTDQGAVRCWGGFGGTGVAAKPASCSMDACPVALGPAMTSVAEIGGGAGAILARKKDGTFVAWGSNTDAMLGNGTKSQTPTQTPVTVLGVPPP